MSEEPPSCRVDVLPLWPDNPTSWPELCARCVAATRAELAAVWPAGAEISFFLADDATVAELNATWRGKDGPTDVLSFPATEPEAPTGSGPCLLGDIAIAYETTRSAADELGLPLTEHLCHLLVHGLLHLLHHTHDEQHDTAMMEQLEVSILARLGIADPYRRAAATAP